MVFTESNDNWLTSSRRMHRSALKTSCDVRLIVQIIVTVRTNTKENGQISSPSRYRSSILTEVEHEFQQSDVLFSEFILSNIPAENETKFTFQSNGGRFKITQKKTRSIVSRHGANSAVSTFINSQTNLGFISKQQSLRDRRIPASADRHSDGNSTMECSLHRRWRVLVRRESSVVQSTVNQSRAGDREDRIRRPYGIDENRIGENGWDSVLFADQILTTETSHRGDFEQVNGENHIGLDCFDVRIAFRYCYAHLCSTIRRGLTDWFTLFGRLTEHRWSKQGVRCKQRESVSFVDRHRSISSEELQPRGSSVFPSFERRRETSRRKKNDERQETEEKLISTLRISSIHSLVRRSTASSGLGSFKIAST